MFTNRNRILPATLAALLSLGLLPALAHAQVGFAGNPVPPVGNPANPYGQPGAPVVPGGLTGNIYGPSLAGPGTDVSNPYSVSGFYPPNYYETFPFSGISKIIDSQGEFFNAEERARLLRLEAYQKHLETRKKAIELERWIKDTTPTFTEEQAKVLAKRLDRIRKAATPAEIWSGNAPNMLLKDLAQYQAQKMDLKPIDMPEDVLRHLNVTVPGGGSLGLLRNEGRFNWPQALADLVEEKTRADIERNAQDLVNQAAAGKVNPNTLKDLDTRIQELRSLLTKKPLAAQNYLRALRFLEDFQSSLHALEANNLAVKYFNYQKWATAQPRKLDELVAYLNSNGLSIAPAAEGDEFAYEALYHALASYDIAYNTQLAAKSNGTQ